MSDVTFRMAAPTDAERLSALMTRTFRETYSAAHFGDSRVEDVEAYIAAHFSPEIQRAELEDPSMRTILVESDGALAGYAQLREGEPPACVVGARPVEVARFYVDRPWHGRGMAHALMARCVAAVPGADPLWLGVFERNGRARAFYAKCGFLPVGRATFRMGDDVQADWLLALHPTTTTTP